MRGVAGGALMLAALSLQLVALVALAIAMPRHGRHIFGRLPSRREERVASALGWLLLALSLALALRRGSDALDLMTWLGGVPLTAGGVLLALAARPRWLVAAAGAGLALTVAGLV